MKSFLREIVVSILTVEARRLVSKHNPKIIVITGSVGKTSTKDAIAASLEPFFDTRKSEKSFNSDIGIPLTILDLKNAWGNPLLWIKNISVGFLKVLFLKGYPKILILEAGADKPGDLKKIFSWLKPDVVVCTRFPEIPVHVESYESPEALREEESIPVRELKKNGLLVLNTDDPYSETLKKMYGGKILTYGLSRGSDIFGSLVKFLIKETESENKVEGITFDVETKKGSSSFEVRGSLGETHVYPILAGVALATQEAVDLKNISQIFRKHKTPPGRMRIIDGINNSTIIDDSYNSSPVALQEALKTIQKIEGFSRKIIVLGDMLELGKYSEEEHGRAGKEVSKVGDVIITVGKKSKLIAESAIKNGFDKNNVFQFEESVSAGDFLKNKISKNDIVLVKGSQSIRLEKVVEKIMLYPEEKKNLLVRQEEEWLKR